MNSGIYRIVCKTTGDSYVGSSARLIARQKEHFAVLKRGTHFSVRLQALWKKHGRRAFKFEVLECVPPDSLAEFEQAWIEKLAPSINRRSAVRNSKLVPDNELRVPFPVRVKTETAAILRLRFGSKLGQYLDELAQRESA